MLAKSFEDLISSAFSSCQTSSLLKTGGVFSHSHCYAATLPDTGCYKGFLRHVRYIQWSVSCCRCAVSGRGELMPGGYNEKGPHRTFPLLLLLCSQHLPLGVLTGRILSKAFSTSRGAILALTCSFGSHSDGFRVQILVCFMNDPDQNC